MNIIFLFYPCVKKIGMVPFLVFFKTYLTSFAFKSFLSDFLIRVRGEVRVRDELGDGFRDG